MASLGRGLAVVCSASLLGGYVWLSQLRADLPQLSVRPVLRAPSMLPGSKSAPVDLRVGELMRGIEQPKQTPNSSPSATALKTAQEIAPEMLRAPRTLGAAPTGDFYVGSSFGRESSRAAWMLADQPDTRLYPFSFRSDQTRVLTGEAGLPWMLSGPQNVVGLKAVDYDNWLSLPGLNFGTLIESGRDFNIPHPLGFLPSDLSGMNWGGMIFPGTPPSILGTPEGVGLFSTEPAVEIPQFTILLKQPSQEASKAVEPNLELLRTPTLMSSSKSGPVFLPTGDTAYVTDSFSNFWKSFWPYGGSKPSPEKVGASAAPITPAGHSAKATPLTIKP